MIQATVDDYLTYIPTGVVRSRFPSSAKTTMPDNPRGLEGIQICAWDSFAETVYKDCTAALNSKSEKMLLPVYEKHERAIPCDHEGQVGEVVSLRLFAPLKRLMRYLGVAGIFRVRPSNVILDPDYGWCSEIMGSYPHTLGGSVDVRIVIEVKTFWEFDVPDDLVPILIGMSSPQSQVEQSAPPTKPLKRDDQGDTSTRDKVVRAVSQIYGYMSLNHLRYGVLATFDKFFFLRQSGGEALSGPSRLEITRVIRRDQTRDTDGFMLMEGWLSLLMAANQDYLFCSPSPPPISKKRKFRIKKRMELLETAKIGDFCFGSLIARSQLGTVVEGGIWGEDERNSVMKIVDTSKSSRNTEKLEFEMSAYRLLNNLQGKVIPKICRFLLINRWIMVLVLSNCGKMIKHHKFVARYNDIRAIVKQIHDAGVAHGDLAFRNILVDRKGKLTIIDFSDANLRIGFNKEEFLSHCKKDWDALERLFDNNQQE